LFSLNNQKTMFENLTQYDTFGHKNRWRLQALSEMQHLPVLYAQVHADESSKRVPSQVSNVWWRDGLLTKTVQYKGSGSTELS
jgi:hypothetical protein